MAPWASKRGRSGFGWFLISAVFSPLLGVIFLLVMQDLSPQAVAKYSEAPTPETHVMVFKRASDMQDTQPNPLSAPQARERPSRRRLVIACVATVLFAAAAGWAGYSAIQQSRVKDLLRPHVKLATIHISRMLVLEVNPSSITWGEYFDKSKASLEEIDRAVIQVRSIATDGSKAVHEPALQYMGRAQQAIRQLTSMWRHRFAADRAERSSANSRGGGSEYAAQRRIEDLNKALDELRAEDAEREPTRKTLEALMVDAGATRKLFGGDAVVDSSEVEALLSGEGFKREKAASAP